MPPGEPVPAAAMEAFLAARDTAFGQLAAMPRSPRPPWRRRPRHPLAVTGHGPAHSYGRHHSVSCASPDAGIGGRRRRRPYDVVNAEEARALAAGNPLSFLHVSRAEIDLPPDTNPYADAVYAKAAENFAALKARAPLVLEDAPSLYVYRLRMGEHVQTGIAGCFSVDDYDRDVIKKHERTRRDKEDDRTRHIIELRAQTGPVFLVHDSRRR